MGNRVVFPAKNPSADFYAQVDMSALLYTGEAVVSADVIVSLMIGDDPGCDLSVSGVATVSQNVITQWIVDGLAGNTYTARFTATTSLGNSVITLGEIAVVSSDPF